MKVLALTRYDTTGASSRVRLLQYLPYLKRAGIDISVSPFLSEIYLSRLYSGLSFDFKDILKSYINRVHKLLSAQTYGVLWVEKELFPWLPCLFENLFLRNCDRIIVDFDDAVFLRYQQHKSSFVRWQLKDKFDRIMCKADHVTVGSRYLFDYAKSLGANVSLLPSVVDLEKYHVRNEPNKNITTVGWIGSPATEKYLLGISDVLKRLAGLESIQITAVGAASPLLSELNIQILPWTLDTEVRRIQQFDIGIMPLQDSQWERGKCGYKLIQYMACGIPSVASSVGMNCEIIEHGKDGFLVRTSEEWIDAINTLLNDGDLYKSVSANAREKVEQRFSVQSCLDEFISVLSK